MRSRGLPLASKREQYLKMNERTHAYGISHLNEHKDIEMPREHLPRICLINYFIANKFHWLRHKIRTNISYIHA